MKIVIPKFKAGDKVNVPAKGRQGVVEGVVYIEEADKSRHYLYEISGLHKGAFYSSCELELVDIK